RGLLPGRLDLPLLRRPRRLPLPVGPGAQASGAGGRRHHGALRGHPRTGLALRASRRHPGMEIKAPIPQIPPAVWTEFKDLQEWEKLHKERPEGDKHSRLFESVEEGIYNFTGGFILTTVADAFLNGARKSSVWPVTFGLPCCAVEMVATFAARVAREALARGPL